MQKKPNTLGEKRDLKATIIFQNNLGTIRTSCFCQGGCSRSLYVTAPNRKPLVDEVAQRAPSQKTGQPAVFFPSRVSFSLWFSIDQISKSQFFQWFLCHQLPTKREENEERRLRGACAFTPIPPNSVLGLPTARATAASGPPRAALHPPSPGSCWHLWTQEGRPLEAGAQRSPHARHSQDPKEAADHSEAPRGPSLERTPGLQVPVETPWTRCGQDSLHLVQLTPNNAGVRDTKHPCREDPSLTPHSPKA